MVLCMRPRHAHDFILLEAQLNKVSSEIMEELHQ